MKTLAEFLERPAGEVLIAFGLMGLGAVFYALKLPKGDEVVMAGLTLVSRALISRAVSQAKPPDPQPAPRRLEPAEVDPITGLYKVTK